MRIRLSIDGSDWISASDVKDDVAEIRVGDSVRLLIVSEISDTVELSAVNDAVVSPVSFGMTIDFDRPDNTVAPAAMTAEAGCRLSMNIDPIGIEFANCATFEVVMDARVFSTKLGTIIPRGVTGIVWDSSW